MADQPDNTPVTPDENPAPENANQPGDAPPAQNKQASETGPLAGWHEPPVPEESSRPVVVEAWFKPDDAITADPEHEEPAEETPQAEAASTSEPAQQLPDVTPKTQGAWYTPPDAALDALLSGADETIVEVHEPKAPPPTPLRASEDTQPQEVADTQGWSVPEPVSEDEAATRIIEAAGTETSSEQAEAQNELEQTPTPDATAPQQAVVELTPAEQALLEEQRAESDIPAQRPGDSQSMQQAEAAPERAADTAAQTTGETVPDPSRFEQVERKVQVLRERFATGHLTRAQLQAELRNLMILGDDGHWWMLGLETNQWYYYDGKNWVPKTPPSYDERVQGSAVRTETGMQEVPDAGGYFDLSPMQQDSTPVDLDGDEEIPLPRRVPQEDPGATLVSPSTPFMEPTRPSDAPTQSKSRQVDEESLVPRPGGQLPERPEQPSGDTGFGDRTIQSAAIASEATMPGTALARQQPRQLQAQQQPQQQGALVVDGSGAGQPPAKPKPRLGEFPQPDYSDALGPSRTWTFYAKWGTVLVVVGSMAATLVVLLAMIGYYLYKVDQYAEAVGELSERAASFENTLIYNARGDALAEFTNPNTGSRTEVPLNEISPWLIHATIATENETFYSDPGFSILAIVRAAIQNLQAGDTVSGASTITQQLARALVLETEFAYQRTAERKIVEIIVASEIKRNYTKNEILQIYLNEIFYGNFSYGIEAAAQIYFDKPASQLNPIESAFLAGLPQSPAQYDPVVNREAAIARMHEVLRLMAEAGGDGCIYIEHQDITDWNVPEGGGLCIKSELQPDGSMAYFYRTPNTDWVDLFVELARVETKVFTAPSTEFTHPHFVNYVWQQLEDTYGPQAIYTAGYRVYTTLDETIQTAAEAAVTANLQRVRDLGYPANNTSVVAIRPSDGAVLAMVGSADYHNEAIKGQVNVAFTAQQPGSTLKPFIYLTAFRPDEQNNYMTPASVIWDVYTNFNGYEPVNYDRQYHGPVTVREALAQSLNIPAVKALEYEGLLRFTEMMTRLGIEFPGGNPVETDAGLPTALGAVDVQLFNLTAAYATLANNGRKVNPYTIVYIEDTKGNPIYEAAPKETEQIVKPEFAYLITDILSDADARAPEFGYNEPMQLPDGRPAAVKTGTSNDSRDVWTLGYTPQLTVGIWVGTTDNDPMYNPTGYPTYYLTGYYGAAPLWNEIMQAAHAGLPVQPFQPPQGVIQVEVCSDSGTQPSQACLSGTHVEIFANSAPPPPPQEDIYRTLQIDEYSGLLANESCTEYVETRTFLVLDDPAAYEWINSTDAGRAWAQQRGIAVPVQSPPTEYCDPNQPRPFVEISYPSEGATIQGVVELRGRIVMQNFSRYEVLYGVSHDPQAFSAPLVAETFTRPDPNSLLGQFDSQTLENGPYTLRLVAIDNQGRDVTRDVHITVNNPQATPIPTTFPTPTLAPTLTPVEQQAIPTVTLAPTLTPEGQ